MINNQKALNEENDILLRMGEVGVPVSRGTSADINKGDFVAITGASGSRKSIMMSLIRYPDIPSKGRMLSKNQDISRMGESDLTTFQEIDGRAASKRTRKIPEFIGLADKIHHMLWDNDRILNGRDKRMKMQRNIMG